MVQKHGFRLRCSLKPIHSLYTVDYHVDTFTIIWHIIVDDIMCSICRLTVIHLCKSYFGYVHSNSINIA